MKFFIGEHVKVFGNDQDVFEIKSFFVKKYVAFGRTSEESNYVLEHVVSKRVVELPKGLLVKIPISVDYLLDTYNDYCWLHQQFGDETYREKANQVMNTLHKHARFI